ncbi:zinc finger A20 and AN1 domain-containing stress-associated protein 4 [Malus domestica]|uniref:zinc finger A20 and AN1 domain-containing stress-associated protein 4 n=1 Tax=Malus domestica TaxID=3750 RepID=UPI0010AAEBED|nr:zinc finger A20 and AN1 domain-containing stress-associated protein 4-like [Malus domestica]
MAEEHRCQPPQLCVNNCGFFGSPTTQNLCSKCYRDLQLKEQQVLALNQTLISSSSSPSSSCLEGGGAEHDVPAAPSAGAHANKCMTCRRRVGLTGFQCRCGMTFCGTHRYPEQHACGFDFRGMGKEQIAKANPVVKADKLQKI